MEPDERHPPFCIVLAAGDGTRLAPLVRRLHGDERPKQFAVLKGERSLLQDTMNRMTAVAPPARTVVVVSDRHRYLAEEQLGGGAAPEVVCQPRNVGTGSGILLPLAHVVARSPQATVVITPSDHHFHRPGRFTSKMSYAIDAAAAAPDGVCLLAVDAEGPSEDLGWIVSGAPLPARPGASTIERFVEKPSLPVARRLYDGGGLWNTFVMVGAAASFWRLAREHMPTQTRLLERYLPAIGTHLERRVLEGIYAELEPADWSRDVLAHARGLAVVSVGGSGWSDWGTPARLFESLNATPELRALERRLQGAPGVGANGGASNSLAAP